MKLRVVAMFGEPYQLAVRTADFQAPRGPINDALYEHLRRDFQRQLQAVKTPVILSITELDE